MCSFRRCFADMWSSIISCRRQTLCNMAPRINRPSVFGVAFWFGLVRDVTARSFHHRKLRNFDTAFALHQEGGEGVVGHRTQTWTMFGYQLRSSVVRCCFEMRGLTADMQVLSCYGERGVRAGDAEHPGPLRSLLIRSASYGCFSAEQVRSLGSHPRQR